VYNRADLWNAVEKKENRKDSQLCRDINLAIPSELNESERLELVREYVRREFVSVGMVADMCLHAPSQGENNRNHHGHIMLTMRRIDGDGFGPKERSWNVPALLIHWRKKWADACNSALEKAGHSERVDHRSHAERGIETPPGQHHGPAVAGIVGRGEHSDVAERQEAERAAQLAAQLAIAQAQATAAAQELADAEADEQARAQAESERQAAEAVAAQAHAAELADSLDRELALTAAALAQAHKAHAAAVLKLEKAVQVESRAEVDVESLRPARDQAIAAQRQAGKSLLKTAQAAVKVPGWLRAIDAFELALAALKRASAAVQRARAAVATTWARVLQLDPIERQRQADALAAQIEASAEADRKRQRERFTTVDKLRRKSSTNSTNANEPQPPGPRQSPVERDRG
jgi:hypothetical protein